MDESFFCLGVKLSAHEVIETLKRILPNGIRTDQTMPEWRGLYINHNENGNLVCLRSYSDGYGNTVSFLVENLAEITHIVISVAPDDHGPFSSQLRLSLNDAFQDSVVDEQDAMDGSAAFL